MTHTDLDPLPPPARPRRSWTRGQGGVRKKHGDWYMRYMLDGKRREEKLSVKTKQEALACLRARIGKIDKGEFLAARFR